MKVFRTILITLLGPTLIAAKAILGVDLGSLYMKVALVQSGSPLEIVTNFHSKRKTEQMILFDQNQRLYGSDANALLARKSQKTATSFSILLGRDDQHPAVRVLALRHAPLTPTFNETLYSLQLTIDKMNFTSQELVAMLLNHAIDQSVAYAAEHGQLVAPQDLVLTVPMFYTQHERQALLDASQLANRNILGLIDENTAAALHYVMDKTLESTQLFLFYNMGANSLQVSLVELGMYDAVQKYGKPKPTPYLHVLAKAWDQTLGGAAFDHLIVELLADTFNDKFVVKQHGTNKIKDFDVRNFPKAMIKLTLQAQKVKHVLSANKDIPVYMDNVHDEVGLNMHITRDMLEDLSQNLTNRLVEPIHKVLNIANKTIADVTNCELIGGGMRIPIIQSSIQTVLSNLELGLHMNADESMALGAAFHGANLSTAFRVRQVGLIDVTPFPMTVSIHDLSMEKKGLFGRKKEDDSSWRKQATLFKSFAKVGVKKTIAFTHDKDVQVALDYEDSEYLPEGSERKLEHYNITGIADFAKETEAKKLGKPKVSLQFEISASGVTSLMKAEAAVEETYTVEEVVEIEDVKNVKPSGNITANDVVDTNSSNDAVGNNATNTTTDTDETAKSNATVTQSDKSQPKATKTVQKEKKRIHKRNLNIVSYYTGKIRPHTVTQIEASKAKLLEIDRQDKLRMQLEEARNRVEAYMYRIKNKLVDDEERINLVSTEEQRISARQLAHDTEDWLLEEGYSANLATLEDKYAELSADFENILLRVEENESRPKAIAELQKRLADVEMLLQKWETSKPQITSDERASVEKKIVAVQTWLTDVQHKQSLKLPHETPAFLSKNVMLQFSPIEVEVIKLAKKPLPKVEKKKVNQTVSENATAVENATTVSENTTIVVENATNTTENAIDNTSSNNPLEEDEL